MGPAELITSVAAASLPSEERTYDAVIVGAGFAGMYMLHRLRRSGLSVRLIEAGSGPGGVWFWNRYPGARCDVESMEYQYGFDDNILRDWTWSERYGTQPEILRYINFVAERLEIHKDTDYNTRIASAIWSEGRRVWSLRTTDGRAIRAQFCVMATGHLSAANIPDLPGLSTFAGKTHHTGEWAPEGVDLQGRNVAVIGTGSSGVQSIPVIAQQAANLFVFQRTPAYSLPAEMRPLSAEEIASEGPLPRHARERQIQSRAQLSGNWSKECFRIQPGGGSSNLGEPLAKRRIHLPGLPSIGRM
jgi:cyclohexanone monooxygenase